MSGVKVIRILEYTYEDQETADRDMMRWGVPPTGAFEGGVRRFEGRKPTHAGSVTIRSAVIQYPFGEELTEAKVNQVMGSVAAIVPGESDGSASTPAAEA